MRRSLIGLGILSIARLASAQATPEQVAGSFWDWHALRQPSGALTADELTEVRGLLTMEFACLLEVAGQFRLHFSKIAPDEKPPFEEGDFFTSSAYERPAKFKIESVQGHSTMATALTRFYSEDDSSWLDRLELRLENGQWKVADVNRGGPFEFGNRGSFLGQLYAAMSRDIPAASWSGRVARECSERPNNSLELPTLGQFNYLLKSRGSIQNRRAVIVGYGLQGAIPAFSQDDWVRYRGESSVANLENGSVLGAQNFQFTNNPGKGNGVGGTCSGDSGGPAFWVDPATGQETNVVMAVNSYSITPLCNGVDYQLRTDIAVTLDFVTPYLD